VSTLGLLRALLLHACRHRLGLKLSGDGPCLGTREVKPDGTRGAYNWFTYNEVASLSTQAGSGLLQLGMRPGTFVGLFSPNRAEWVIVEQACYMYSLVPVPLYDTLGMEAVQFVLRQAALEVVVCAEDKVSMLLECARLSEREGAPLPLRYIVTMNPGAGTGIRHPNAYAASATLIKGDSSAATGSVLSLSWDALLAAGAAAPAPHVPPAADDLSTLCYTSGTTGDPKGAMLTHGNFAAGLAGTEAAGIDLRNTDVHLSYLPLAHVFERIVQATVFHRGGAVGFFSGDVSMLLDDLATLKPTIFPSVPRLFNRIYDKITAGVKAAGGLRQALFEYAYASKAYYLDPDAGGHTTHSVWDSVVFARMRDLLGGRVRLMLTGSAPISPAVKEFLQVVFCCPVYEGYGLTETVGVATLTPYECRYPGHVGPVVASTELKLVDVADMGYTAKDTPFPRGEVCLRGPNIFKGYYKEPAKTAEAIDSEGWFHTGDIGRVNGDGTLSIIDRKKNIFKLAQGEYIAPEKIEGIYSRASLIAQVFVHGESVKSCAVAVVVPDPDTLGPWAKQHGIAGSSVADWVKDPRTTSAIESQMTEVADKAGLKGFERARAIFVTAEPFDVSNNLLTPTFKLKRPELRKYFGEQIAAMYAKLGE
jgi:long-chain acyl-CoA synthetase